MKKYFVDCQLPDGIKKNGMIAWPESDAKELLKSIKQDHPDWIIELNLIEQKTI